MKKIFNLLLIALFCVSAATVASCKKNTEKDAQEEIVNAVKTMSLPSKISDTNNLIECTYEDNVLTLTVEVTSEKAIDVDKAKQEEQTLKSLRGMLNRKLISRLVEANAVIRYVYKYNDGEKIEFSFPASQFKSEE